MRARLFLMTLLSLSACDRREKEMEQARIADIQKLNEKEGNGDLYWEATGEKHATWVLVRNHGTNDTDQIRDAIEKSITGLSAGKEEFERDGFTHVGVRDRDTGIMVTKPVAELRGMAAAFVDGADDKPASPVPPSAPRPPATHKEGKQSYCAEKGSTACCSYTTKECVFVLCRSDNFREWKEVMDHCK